MSSNNDFYYDTKALLVEFLKWYNLPFHDFLFTTEEEVIDHYLKEHEPQPTAPRPITREGLTLDAKTGDVMPEWLYDKTTSRWIDGVCEKCGYVMGVDAWSEEVHFCPCCESRMIGEINDKE